MFRLSEVYWGWYIIQYTTASDNLNVSMVECLIHTVELRGIWMHISTGCSLIQQCRTKIFQKLSFWFIMVVGFLTTSTFWTIWLLLNKPHSVFIGLHFNSESVFCHAIGMKCTCQKKHGKFHHDYDGDILYKNNFCYRDQQVKLVINGYRMSKYSFYKPNEL